LAILRLAAAGITINADTSKAPTILMDTATVMATIMVNIIFTKLTGIPDIKAASSSNVMYRSSL
jgi:hypothetical protein